MAIENGKPLLPVRVEDIAPAGALDYLLRLSQWLDLFPGSIGDHSVALQRMVAQLLGERGIPIPEPAPQPIGEPRTRRLTITGSRITMFAMALVVLVGGSVGVGALIDRLGDEAIDTAPATTPAALTTQAPTTTQSTTTSTAPTTTTDIDTSSAPSIALSTSLPEWVTLGETFDIHIDVANPAIADISNVVIVARELDVTATFVSSDPAGTRESSDPRQPTLSVPLGVIDGASARRVTLTYAAPSEFIPPFGLRWQIDAYSSNAPTQTMTATVLVRGAG